MGTKPESDTLARGQPARVGQKEEDHRSPCMVWCRRKTAEVHKAHGKISRKLGAVFTSVHLFSVTYLRGPVDLRQRQRPPGSHTQSMEGPGRVGSVVHWITRPPHSQADNQTDQSFSAFTGKHSMVEIRLQYKQDWEDALIL